MEKDIFFVDMDGTIAEFDRSKTLDEIMEEGYFRKRPPIDSVIKAVKVLHEENIAEVHILSAYLSESKYAASEKLYWIKEHMPWVNKDNIHLVPCGESKSEFLLKNGFSEKTIKDSFLLDDFSANLKEWPGYPIKIKNGINGTHGSWFGKATIRAASSSEDIVKQLRYYIKEYYQYDVYDAVLVELNDKGSYKRFVLAPYEFQDRYGLSFSEDACKSAIIPSISDTLKPMVHLYAQLSIIGDENWEKFLTDMAYGIPKEDVYSGNTAYIDVSEQGLLNDCVIKWVQHLHQI